MWEEDASATYRPRQRILLGDLQKVLQRAPHTVGPNGALLPPAERGGGAPKSDHRRDDKVIADDERDAWEVLGRGGHDGRLPQSVANAKPRWEDATRGLVQQVGSDTSSTSVRLCHMMVLI